MSSPLLIAFGHRSGHGKDTAAKFLDTHLRCKVPGLKVKKLSFADKLKDICYQLYGWTGIKRPIEYENNRELRKDIIPALNCTIVDLWIDVGEKLREVYPETWMRYVTENSHGAQLVLIPDLRHPNEIAGVGEKGGRYYKIDNPNIPPREGKSIDDYLAGFDDWHGTFLNDGELKKLNSLMDMLSDSLIREFDLAPPPKPA